MRDDSIAITIDGKAVSWQEYTNENGVKYAVAYLGVDDPLVPENNSAGFSKIENFSMDVDWYPSSSWEPTTPIERERSNITNYRNTPFIPFPDRSIWEFSTLGSCKYTFIDATGQILGPIVCRELGRYAIIDNSTNPKIKVVMVERLD